MVHELSYATALLDALENSAAANGIRRVTTVRIEIGEEIFLLPESLEFAFSALAASRGDLLLQAQLEMTLSPGREFRLASFEGEE